MLTSERKAYLKLNTRLKIAMYAIEEIRDMVIENDCVTNVHFKQILEAYKLLEGVLEDRTI